MIKNQHPFHMILQTVCNYALVRFVPYPESEEFVNVGFVLLDGLNRRLMFRLETERFERVHDFFPALDPKVYPGACELLSGELQRLCNLVNGDPASGQPPLDRNEQGLKTLFQDIVRPREGLIDFSGIRTLLTDDVEAELDKLFAHYVVRHQVHRVEQSLGDLSQTKTA